MATTNTPHIVGFVLSLLLLLLLMPFQVKIAEAKRNLPGQERLQESPLPPTSPIYLPPSKSRRGRGP
ncbi:unnamed protein product [Brassica rapa subsp. trilocularis]